MLPKDPTELRSVHCKFYLEPSVAKAIKEFQADEGLSSFSEAGRKLLLLGFDKEECKQV